MATNPEKIASQILDLSENDSVTVEGLDHAVNKARSYAIRVEHIETTEFEYCVYTTGEDGSDYVVRLSRPTNTDSWKHPTISPLNTPSTHQINQLH